MLSLFILSPFLPKTFWKKAIFRNSNNCWQKLIILWAYFQKIDLKIYHLSIHTKKIEAISQKLKIFHFLPNQTTAGSPSPEQPIQFYTVWQIFNLQIYQSYWEKWRRSLWSKCKVLLSKSKLKNKKKKLQQQLMRKILKMLKKKP